MRIGLKHAAFAAGCAAVMVGAAVAAPLAAADRTPAPIPAQPAPVTVTTTVLTAAPAPGPQDNQSCTSGATATKCVKQGDAEINASIPAPFAGPWSIYGPFYAGGAG
ncbi:MAG TPA: hypothetical protein VMU34_03180 [Mycobacterium sp.]|nr:hypothetical protein [Mycobacterium sp.]